MSPTSTVVFATHIACFESKSVLLHLYANPFCCTWSHQLPLYALEMQPQPVQHIPDSSLNVCRDLAIPKRVEGLQGVNVVLLSGQVASLHLPCIVIQSQYLSNLCLRCRDLAIPKRVEGLQGVNVVLLSGGWRHAVAADDQGRMFGWGWNKVSHSSVTIIHPVISHSIISQ